MEWLCWHLFYHSHQDDILTDAVAPLVDALYADRSIDQFFFLRYWNGGPHVRLRFRPQAQVDGASLAARIEDALRTGVAIRPSMVPMDELTYRPVAGRLSAAEAVAVEPLADNNVLVRRDYTPEYGKYGRGDDMRSAEAIFSASSTAVLRILSRAPNTGRRLGAALVGMMVGLAALGFDRAGAELFFSHYHRFWDGHARGRGNGPTDDVIPPPAVTQAASAILVEGRIPAAWAEWAAVLARSRPGQDDDRRAFLATNHFHTTNNRLGLLTADEAHIGKLGTRCLASLAAGLPL